MQPRTFRRRTQERRKTERRKEHHKEDVMKRFVIGALKCLAFLVGAFAACAYAQSDLFNGFNSFKDFHLPPPPCPPNARAIAVSTVVYETHQWDTYLCGDGTAVKRVYLRPNDNAAPPVMIPKAAACPGLPPGPGFTCVGGGWKPPNWRP